MLGNTMASLQEGTRRFCGGDISCTATEPPIWNIAIKWFVLEMYWEYAAYLQ